MRTDKFVQDAYGFIEKRNETLKKQNKLYLILAFFGLSLSSIAILAVCLMIPLKKIEPYLIRVDNNTGKTDILTVLPKETRSYSQVVDNHFLTQYVQYRESYDWYTINDYYQAVLLMSNGAVAGYYKKLYGPNNTNSPVNVLQNRYRIQVKVNSISYIGKTAQIRFTKTKIPVVSQEEDEAVQQTETENFNYIATVTFKYSKSSMMNTSQRNINPLGFIVTSYKVDRDNTL